MPAIISSLPMSTAGGKEPLPASNGAAQPVDSGGFASILGREEVSSPAGVAPTPEHELFPGGGKVLQPGGKKLPEQPATELDALVLGTTPAVVAEPASKDIATAEDMNLQLPAVLPAAMRFERVTPAEGVAVAEVGSQAGVTPDGQVAGPVLDPGRPRPADPDTSAAIGRDMAGAIGGDMSGTQGIAAWAPAGSLPPRYSSRAEPGNMWQQSANPGDRMHKGLQFSGNIAKAPPMQAVAESGADSMTDGVLGSSVAGGRMPEGLQFPGNIAKAPPMQAVAESRAGSMTDGVIRSPVPGDFQVDIPLELVEAVKVADVKVAEQLQFKPPSIDQATVIAGSNALAGRELELPGGLKIAASPTITTPVGHPGWSGELAGRVNLMVNGGRSEASLQLTPPELGRLEIRISTEDDQAKILFTVQNTHAREAIEQAMPRLRDALEQSGLQLAHSSVADQSGSRRGESGTAGSGIEPAPADLEFDSENADQTVLALASDATVDYYV